jgi:hypothetical protein
VTNSELIALQAPRPCFSRPKRNRRCSASVHGQFRRTRIDLDGAVDVAPPSLPRGPSLTCACAICIHKIGNMLARCMFHCTASAATARQVEHSSARERKHANMSICAQATTRNNRETGAGAASTLPPVLLLPQSQSNQDNNHALISRMHHVAATRFRAHAHDEASLQFHVAARFCRTRTILKAYDYIYRKIRFIAVVGDLPQPLHVTCGSRCSHQYSKL